MCPSCGRANPPGFRFCGTCGASLERQCPSCGAPNPASFGFCGSCGWALEPPAPAEIEELEERKLVTVLFADLTASTELAASMDPEDLGGVLQPFFAAMAEEIERVGGTVEKFIGDAVVAIFGVPTAHEDDPERAVRAAMAMQRRLQDLNASRPAGTPLAMRVGVHTGEVVATPRSERHGMVTGEAVNIAARLQAEAKPGMVVVGERTYRDTRHIFELGSLGSLDLKGVDRPVTAWHVVGERPQSERRAIARAPLVGRGPELDLLRLLLARTERERRPNLVTILGAAGIGKSRLAREFLTGVSSGARVVRGRCLPYGEGLTYRPLSEILKADAGVLDSDDAPTSLGKARRLLEGRLGREHGAGEVVLSSVGLAGESDPLTGTDSSVAREMITRSWRLYFEARAADAPLLVLVEDLHWADPGLLDVLEGVVARGSGPMLFLCTARSELTEHRPAWGAGVRNAATIELSPLSPDESRALVEHLLGARDPPGRVLAQVLEQAEGNPFFAEELLRMLIEDGVLVRRGRSWVVERDVPTVLPDTVQGAIASRIDRLPSGEKRIVQNAAVVGRIFWEGAIESLGSREAATAVDALIEKGLVRERDGSSIEGERELIFHHVLTRDVSYQSIPRHRRAEAHAAAGRWLEAVTRGRSEEFAEILAYHFELAADRIRAARYATLAGHRKRRLFAAEEAIRWYERAAAMAPEGPDGRQIWADASVGRGEALEQVARFAEAEESYRRALRTARDLGEETIEARALSALVHVLWLQDRFDEGREALPEALNKARALRADDLLARLLYTGGTMAFGRGEWKESVAYHREAVQVARGAGDIEGQAFAEHGLCETYDLWGYFAEGLEHGLRSSELLRKVGNRPMLYHNEYMVALGLWALGRLAESLRSYRGALEGAHELGDRRNEAAARQAGALTRLWMGDLGGALADADRAVEIQREVPSPRQQLTGLVFRMDTLAELRAMDRLAEDVPRARALSDEIGGRYVRPRLSAYEAWLALDQEDEAAAHSLFERARRESADVPFEALVSARLELLAWHEARDPAAVRAAADLLIELAEERSPPFLAWGKWGQAAAAALAGEWEEALRWTEASRAAGAGPESPAAWRAAAVASRACAALGRGAEASAWRQDATAILRRMVEGLDDPPARAAFLGRPDVAELLES